MSVSQESNQEVNAMKLIDVGKLDYLKVSSHGLFKVGMKDSPEEYSAVKSPVKIKFAPDIFLVFTAEIGDDGRRCIRYSILHSTERKFKDNYVKDLCFGMFSYDADRAMLKFRT